jgi:hypothetical protein
LVDIASRTFNTAASTFNIIVDRLGSALVHKPSTNVAPVLFSTQLAAGDAITQPGLSNVVTRKEVPMCQRQAVSVRGIGRLVLIGAVLAIAFGGFVSPAWAEVAAAPGAPIEPVYLLGIPVDFILFALTSLASRCSIITRSKSH